MNTVNVFNTNVFNTNLLKKCFVPGYLHDITRVVYFFIFLVLTIVQTYLALI